MAKDKCISDEQVISVLMNSRTFTEAAEKLGLSTKTLNERMNDREFRISYSETKAAVVRNVLSRLTDQATAAVDALTDIMQDKETNGQIRVQAAQTVLNSIARLSASLTAADAVTEQAKTISQFDFSY